MATGRRSNYSFFLNDRNGEVVSPVLDAQLDGTRTYTASLAAMGAAKGTVTFFGSTVRDVGFEVIGSIDLEATDGVDSGSFPGEVPWNFVKAEITGLDGNAEISAWMGL
jgi:hypothetical protein